MLPTMTRKCWLLRCIYIYACMLAMRLWALVESGWGALPNAWTLGWERQLASKQVDLRNEELAHGALVSLQALALVLMQTWPRVPAHAQLLWRHLEEEYDATASSTPHCSHEDYKDFSFETHHGFSQVSEDSLGDGTGRRDRLDGNGSESKGKVLEGIVKAAEILWRTGGEAFQKYVQHKVPESQGALLQRIVSMQNIDV